MARSSAVTKPLEGADTEIRAGQHRAPLLVSSEPSRERSWPTHTAGRRVPHCREQRRGGATPRPAGKNLHKTTLCLPPAHHITGITAIMFYKTSLYRDFDSAIRTIKRIVTLKTFNRIPFQWKIIAPPNLVRKFP